MPSTTNKLYSVQSTGSNAGTWGDGPTTSLNQGCFEIIDTNLGGVLTLTLASSNVTLTAAQARNCMVRLSGTLTGAVQITSANIGFYMVENVTSGSFAVTWTNGVGSAVTITQSRRFLLFADATNGVRIISNVSLTGADPTPVPAGTVMLFLQSAAPTGWTISSSFADRAIQIVNSGGGSTGGTVAFSTLFARTTTDNYTLITANLPPHTHPYSGITGMESATHTHSGTTGGVSANHTHGVTGSTGGESTTHTHTFTTGGVSANHTHTYSRGNVNLVVSGLSAGTALSGALTSDTTSTESADHTHSGTTAVNNVGHTHAVSITSSVESVGHTHNITSGTESATHTHTSSGTTDATGGGLPHTHDIDMRLSYATAIVCSKDA